MPAARFFSHKSSGVHHAAFLLALATIASGLLGLARDRLLASHFGASRSLDIYYAAFRIPDFIFTLSLFFVATTAFIPLFLERRSSSGREAQEFFDSIFTLFVAGITGVVIIVFFAMPFLTRFVVPGFDEASRATTLTLMRIMLLSPLFLGISSLVSGVAQASRRFFAFALAPVAYNFGIIIGILWFVPIFGLAGLALGVVLGAILHLAVQLPALKAVARLPRLRIARAAESLSIVRFSFPRAVSLSLNQVTFFALTAIGSTLSIGSIAIFNLSYNLAALPIMVVGLSYSIAAFPSMAELFVNNKQDEFFENVQMSLRHIFFWTIPLTALFLVLRAHLVRLVLGAGAFGWVDTRLTTASIFVFAGAIVAQSATTLFIRAYHAAGRPRETIFYNAASMFVTMLVTLISVEILRSHTGVSNALGVFLRIEDLKNRELLALPFGYVVGSLTNAYLLGTNLFRKRAVSLWAPLRNSILASVGMAAAAYGTLQLLSLVITLDTFSAVFVEMAIAGSAAVAVGVWLFSIMRVPEFFEIRYAVLSRLGKEELIQADIERP